ncbi:alanine racemase [Rhizohabitans arisaemae]|uniref:alanine racemase n=1 Tax=Rhizohabitans arisaemae TaxID=2720610 RepID=UPI0024B18F99|nr:alanine racemase [Rhizohabitans arisaemae]
MGFLTSASPAEARVDLSAIRHNVSSLGGRAPGAEVMMVVKADGYGHGAVACARAALEAGATCLGTAFIQEALELRAAGITAPVLAWILPPGAELDRALTEGIELSAGVGWLLDEIAGAARRTGRPARIHLKVDTGITRGGATPAEWAALVEHGLALQAEGLVRIVGLWSHFACADEPGHPSIADQLELFDDAVNYAEKVGVSGAKRHIANSAATLTVPEAHYDLVRLGIAAYGLNPIPRLGDFGLRPAMTLAARIALAKRVPSGSGVSYGHSYVTERRTTVGLVPIGYADGIPRHGSNTCQVLVGGVRRTIAGRVCMDQFLVDVGDDELAAGDEVILFGPGDHGEPTAQEWADCLNTITYEIVTGIGPRVSRVYPVERP